MDIASAPLRGCELKWQDCLDESCDRVVSPLAGL